MTKFLLFAAAFFSLNVYAGTTVGNKGTGGVDITISGGQGSQAEKLYNSLSKIPEQAEGAHNGASKQVTGVYCEYLSPGSKRKATYTCVISLSYAGELIPLEP